MNIETENLTVGTPVDGVVVATVSGGLPPYTLPLDSSSSSLPDGVTLAVNNSGSITMVGTPTTASTSTEQVLVNVTDSAPVTAQAKAAKK